ncbi:MAG TPA: hypothetical protein VM686_32635 [Polyangiaceae bacterium]|nr:hypothetical protein [Polyangiaceae bacterium]
MKRPSLLHPITTIAALPVVAALVFGCGGGKPAESADSASTDDSSETSAAPASEGDKEEASDETAEKSDTKEEAKADAKPEEPKSDSPAGDSPGPTAPRTPKDIVTAPDVLFMFSFNDSDMKKDAEEKCEKSSKGDGKKNADCMAKARKKVDHDGMGFKQDKSGGWVWTTIKRNGNVLVTLHQVPIEFGEETKNSITIKTTGKDTGKKPKTPPAKVTFGVPNDYQISRKDPQHGLMVYEAKIGIVGDGGKADPRAGK